MLSLDPKDLYREITHAEQVRDQRLEGFDRRVSRIRGPIGAMDSTTQGQASAFELEYYTTMIDEMVGGDVTVSAQTARANVGGGWGAQVATVFKHFGRRWARDTGLMQWLLPCVAEFLGAWSCAFMTMQPHPVDVRPDGSPAWAPKMVHVPPRRLILDPQAETLEQARFIGHRWVCDVDDLKRRVAELAKSDDTWDAALAETLTPDSSHEQTFTAGNDRKEITGIDLWIPEVQPVPTLGPRQGFHGAFLTVIPNQGGNKGMAVLRRAAPARCPRTGPYAIGGAYWLPGKDPGSIFPLSPLGAIEHFSLRVEAVKRTANAGAASYRRVLVVERSDDEAANVKRMLESPDGTVLETSRLDNANGPRTLEFGGVTDAQLRAVEFQERELQRVSGMDAAGAGSATGDATATESAIAAESRGQRRGRVIDAWYQWVSQIVTLSCWYAYHDSRVFYALGAEAAAEVNAHNPYLLGGVIDPAVFPFDALEISIKAGTLRRLTPEARARQTVGAYDWMINAVPAMLQTGDLLDWQMIVEDMADALGRPALVDVVRAEALAQVSAAARAGAEGGGDPAAAASPGQSRAASQLPVQGTGLPGNRSGARAAGAARQFVGQA